MSIGKKYFQLLNYAIIFASKSYYSISRPKSIYVQSLFLSTRPPPFIVQFFILFFKDWGSSWDATPALTPSSSSKDDEKRLREEKREARKAELANKRAAKKGGGGAMKLGMKKNNVVLE